MYHFHIGARKLMKKGRKISWAATTQGIGRRGGGIPKSAHVYSNHYFSAKKKKTLLLIWGDHQKISCQAQIYLVSALV